MRDKVCKKSLTVLAASNLNHRYLDCVPHFIDFWLHFQESTDLSVTPHVILVAEELPEFLTPYRRYISLCAIRDLNSAFVAQNVRTVMAGNFATDFVMTSDIDMLPLSLKVTKRALDCFVLKRDSFVIVRDVLDPGQYAICYSIARPTTWKKVMIRSKFSNPMDELYAIALENGVDVKYDGKHGGQGWFLDQEVLYRRIHSTRNINVIGLKDFDTGHRRLDRARFPTWSVWPLLPLIGIGYFSDYHVHLPITRSHKLLQAISKVLLFGKKAKRT